MCGRFQSSSPTSDLVERYGARPASDTAEAQPKWNVAPTDAVRVVRQPPEGQLRLEAARWGLHPSGAARLLINVRAETLLGRAALRWSRVVVPADGFYEWRPSTRGSEPFHFRRTDGDLLSLAGMWAPGADGAPASVAIVTTDGGEDLAGVHDRMPVVLEEGDWQQWLEAPGGQPWHLAELLRPSPARTLVARRVSTQVNRVSNDGPALLDPPPEDAATQPMLEGFG
ncbi:MAG TPA: SOS response-associated peptidase [Acidimicrobiales bacterium]|nr:SOS response-associated peptidase [Acidimicrobiales bacterium]